MVSALLCNLLVQSFWGGGGAGGPPPPRPPPPSPLSSTLYTFSLHHLSVPPSVMSVAHYQDALEKLHSPRYENSVIGARVSPQPVRPSSFHREPFLYPQGCISGNHMRSTKVSNLVMSAQGDGSALRTPTGVVSKAMEDSFCPTNSDIEVQTANMTTGVAPARP